MNASKYTTRETTYQRQMREATEAFNAAMADKKALKVKSLLDNVLPRGKRVAE